jgi:hypothetical protein
LRSGTRRCARRRPPAGSSSRSRRAWGVTVARSRRRSRRT